MRSTLWRHKTRGTTYLVLEVIPFQCSTMPELDGKDLIRYRALDGNRRGQVYGRLRAEFEDGRFEKITPRTYRPLRGTGRNAWLEHPFINGIPLCACGARLKGTEQPRGDQPLASGRHDTEICDHGRKAIILLLDGGSP